MSRSLQYFLAVAEEQSFTHAAEKLYISQSALTKYIKRLEESLGVILFERTSPVRLTYAGELYLQYVKEASQQEKELYQKFDEINHDNRGKIRMGIARFRSSILLPDILPVFKRHYPSVEIELIEMQSRELVTELLNDRIDFCISNPLDVINYTNLHYEPLYQEKLLLAVDAQYPALRRFVANPAQVHAENQHLNYPMFDIHQIENESFLLLQPQQSLSYAVENFLHSQGITLRNVFRTTSMMTAVNLAAAGLGFCFVPDLLSRKERYFPNDLLYFRFAETDIAWENAAFYRKNVTLSKHSRAFIDLVKEFYHASGPFSF